VVLTTPIIEGLDGVQKMSKSLGNAIGIQEPPLEMYIKIMRISDELMWRYYELLTDEQVADIEKMKRDSHPMEAKKDLARRIISDFHSAEAAGRALEDWSKRKEIADDVAAREVSVEKTPDGRLRLDKMVYREGLADSVTDAVRKIGQGAVRVNGLVMTDTLIHLSTDQLITLQVGNQKPVKLRAKLVVGIKPVN
jgi:tyrosyl-tRNA synthetase